MIEPNGATLIHGDCRKVLKTLDAESVHCCVTSIPYWGLRSYGTEPQVWGGDPANCDHDWQSERYYREGGGSGGSKDAFHEPGPENAARLKETRWRETTGCSQCGAWRGEFGLEPTPDLFVQHVVEVFQAVWRVLRKDGTLWLNLGDCFNAYNGGAGPSSGLDQTRSSARPALPTGYGLRARNLKPKDLVGVPWMAAFALRADGWYLRQAITWCKPAPMPESVTDRCTSATEMLFMFAKQERYWYDQDAIREPCSPDSLARMERGRSDHHKWADGGPGGQTLATDMANACHPNGRNRRNWWVVNTATAKDAHFAVMPEELAGPCILAGCPVGGTVLDPFAGSGTTGRVATRLGRRSILIDLKPEYLAIARKRTAQKGLML